MNPTQITTLCCLKCENVQQVKAATCDNTPTGWHFYYGSDYTFCRRCHGSLRVHSVTTINPTPTIEKAEIKTTVKQLNGASSKKDLWGALQFQQAEVEGLQKELREAQQREQEHLTEIMRINSALSEARSPPKHVSTMVLSEELVTSLAVFARELLRVTK